MKNSIKILIFLIIIMILFNSCAHVPAEVIYSTSKIYGFWSGLWHGFIASITFIGSLFNHNIAVYAINNNGGWYNLGFLLSVGIWSGCGVKMSNNRK